MNKDIFCKIVAGEIPSYKVYEDEHFLAFLNINPIRLGGILIIPKEHYETVYDMPDELFASLMIAARGLGEPLKLATGAEKAGIMVIGLDIPHAHVHIIPIDNTNDIDFSLEHPESAENLAKMAELIKSKITSQ